jgi:hypothetical protein
MTNRIQATFTARRFSDGSTVLTCRETGTRYSFSERHPFDSTPIFREGKVMAYRRGRAPILAAIESDARWQIRDEQRQERAETRHCRLTGSPSAIWL